MSPRRPNHRRHQSRLRVRRGIPQGVTSGQSRLAVTAPAPDTFQNAIPTGGATVRLLSADGEPLFIAGVPVTVSLPLGVDAVLAASPGATVLTDAQGIASFDALTLTGLAGTYTLEYAAPGYTGASTTGHTLVAGTAVAGQSIASVPNGREDSETVVVIRLRDQSGNELAVAGASSVTVTVTGTNPVPQTTVPFADGGYTFRYTPGSAGTDTLTIRYGGTQISGSPYTSVVSLATGGFHAGSLRVGYHNMQDVVGTGPKLTGGNWNSVEPIYRLNHISAVSPATLEGFIPIADEKDILLVMTFPSGPSGFTDSTGDCRRWNETKWVNEATPYTGRSVITSALKRRRLIWYMFDEPWHSHFCNTITPAIVRDRLRWVKTQWPDCLIVCRIEPQYLRGGWGGSGALPVNYFDKMDYAFATYRGSTRSPSQGETPQQYFARARTIAFPAGYGLMYSHNWPNLGDPADCWPAFGPGDTRSGRIHGENSNLNRQGQIDLCSTAPGEERYWVESIQRQLDIVSAAAEDPQAPCVFFWQHSAPGALGTPFTNLQKRADMVAMGVSAIQTGENRPSWTGWRTAK